MDRDEIRSCTIAIPGKLTSAYLALKLWEPAAQTVAMPFDEILEAVRDGQVDVGLIIHEGQLTYADEDLVVFRPTTEGDYSAGSFFRLIDGSDVGLGDIRGVTLVETPTVVVCQRPFDTSQAVGPYEGAEPTPPVRPLIAWDDATRQLDPQAVDAGDRCVDGQVRTLLAFVDVQHDDV